MALKMYGDALKTGWSPEEVAGLIAKTQRPSGEIPWSDGDKTDPWDHVEAAMGLGIGGFVEEARKAFRWMAREQLEDGAWYASYRDGKPEDRTRDTNMTAYIAVGVFHHYLLTRDRRFLREMWETVHPAMEFALSLQNHTGEIFWAMSPEGKVDPMALLTGCSSIYMSLKCSLAMARELGVRKPAWEEALRSLGAAVRNRPALFNMTKSRFSMDWFYPILCGAVTGEAAQARVDKYWKKFVVKDRGVRCVSDQPWITMAETSELCIALAAMGNHKLSEIVFGLIQEDRYEDGSYWCGYTFPDRTVWPEEKLTWTNAAVLLAADALYHISPAGDMFSHRFWLAPEYASIIGEGAGTSRSRGTSDRQEPLFPREPESRPNNLRTR
jgi:hypothetical protein